jgi:NAD(P)-dependent dehydrogenase (short-subunit alcohol dehydrogenase family)
MAHTTKTALITGANKGIGLEAARQLGTQGWRVLIGARDSSRAEAAVAALKAARLDAHAVAIDVDDEASIAAAARDVERRFGGLDVLVNNAGVNLEFGGSEGPLATTRAHFEGTLRTNFLGPVSAIAAFAPLLAKTKGRIINVSSTLGSLTALSDPSHMFYGFTMPAYNASKTALNALTVAYAQALKPQGIAVVSVCPGWVRTDMGSDAAPRSVEQGAAIVTHVATMANPPSGGFIDENGSIAW